MTEYIPKSKYLGANVKVELDFSNYATKIYIIYIIMNTVKNFTTIDLLLN